jgi:hypothetical protein
MATAEATRGGDLECQLRQPVGGAPSEAATLYGTDSACEGFSLVVHPLGYEESQARTRMNIRALWI